MALWVWGLAVQARWPEFTSPSSIPNCVFVASALREQRQADPWAHWPAKDTGPLRFRVSEKPYV